MIQFKDLYACLFSPKISSIQINKPERERKKKIFGGRELQSRNFSLVLIRNVRRYYWKLLISIHLADVYLHDLIMMNNNWDEKWLHNTCTKNLIEFHFWNIRYIFRTLYIDMAWARHLVMVAKTLPILHYKIFHLY